MTAIHSVLTHKYPVFAEEKSWMIGDDFMNGYMLESHLVTGMIEEEDAGQVNQSEIIPLALDNSCLHPATRLV
jgi:hypothetical protein